MKELLIIVVFFTAPFLIKAQSKSDSILIDIESQNKEVFNSRVYTLSNKEASNFSPGSKEYESQGTRHSAYIIFNPDSTYVYYSVFEVGFDVAVGKWSQLDSAVLILNLDKEKTLDYTNDEKKYKKYFKYSSPNMVPMTNWLVRRTANKLEPIK